jgi:protein gp37
MSKIEWTEKTWNPIVGCSLASPGCTNCYAMKMAGRLEAMGQSQYQGTTQRTKNGFAWTGVVNVAPDSVFLAPLQRKIPTTYFVNSMSDMFHPSVPDYVIDRVFAIMALTPWHTYQVLTKRADRMRAYLTGRDIDARIDSFMDEIIGEHVDPLNRRSDDIRATAPSVEYATGTPLSNVWLGVSTEDQARADERIPDLLATPAAVRFLSCEPLLGRVDLTAIGMQTTDPIGFDVMLGKVIHKDDGDQRTLGQKVDWVIVGGESGSGARLTHSDWVILLRDQCAVAGIPFFVKQLSSGGSKAIKDIEQFPSDLRIRELPL